MNKQECDVLLEIKKQPYINQRILAEATGHSLGIINRCMKALVSQEYLDKDFVLTAKAYDELKLKSPQRAIILAAGFGMRMVPINMETPKALVEIKGEVLIERTIRQLHEAGIKEIYIVVGFLKEKFEYLIDKYGVELIVNSEYAQKNNLHSMKRALPYLENTYIIPCDIWCKENPYHAEELYSWYTVSEQEDRESTVRVNRKMELVQCPATETGNRMVGISYLTGDKVITVRENIENMCLDSRYDGAFWEEALYRGNRMMVAARVVPKEDAIEINTYEQLRELDSDSNHLRSEAIQVIAEVFQVKQTDVRNIEILKKGMTNRSFRFICKDRKYIMRIPGEGTEQLINRRQEAKVYEVLGGRAICDPVIYINPENGYKITEFLEEARCCNALDENDVKKCMERLRQFHEMKLKVDHEFDLFSQMDFYESLWGETPSVYPDYRVTKEKVTSLKGYIQSHVERKTLSHIDAVPDNFLFAKTKEKEKIFLIDWEYAGMQDPHVDIAMFGIYSLYNRKQMDQLIDLYFEGNCRIETRIKIYCYVAVCGLLWSNWCEYKRNLGVEFGEYSLRQYRYAKEYYQIVQEEMKKLEENCHA